MTENRIGDGDFAIETGLNSVIRALVVDDDPTIRAVSEGFIVMCPDLVAETTLAGSAKEALEILQHNSNVNLLITDYVMPNCRGDQLIREAKGKNPNLICVLMSTDPYALDQLGEYEPLIDFTIKKPFTPEGLRNKLKEVEQKLIDQTL